ncbi:MAG: hypothetical protein VX529_16360 [Pseudomonadota bacterium]|nr:hypothetical protein [Pseudomonadota bacterium]
MRKYASLHAGLLARKGEAVPAIPSGFAGASYVDRPAQPLPVPDERRDVERRSDRPLFVRKPADETGDLPPVCCAGGDLPGLAEDPHAGLARPGRAEVRLTAEQKRRLRTVSVQTGRSQQRILSAALDAWLDQLCETEMRHCACLKLRPESPDPL